ncbi:MAG: hypothetical protein LBI90_05490 [Treponema sp.]|nr:hypothetical protein [Treponema sp.]
MNITEIQDELFRLEYPNLSRDHDPDIERYFYLRGIGQSQDALFIFQNRIIPRYPDPLFRTELMRSYRKHSSSFRLLLDAGYRALAARSLERIRAILGYIAKKIETYNPRDIYSTIKTAEDILALLPRERYEAVEGMDRFSRYADALEFHQKSIFRASELIRSYLNQSLSVIEDERRRQERLRLREEKRKRQRLVKEDWESYRRQKLYGFSGPAIDFSRVVFSPADLARIEIPSRFSSLEDQTLAFCVKYWNFINDSAFERILFLYSRKFGKKNYDVFLAIRRGRAAKRRDDEILASVLSSLTTGYYYSIRGDRYLQRNWNSLKYALENAGRLRALPAPASGGAEALRVSTEAALPAASGLAALPSPKGAPSAEGAAGPQRSGASSRTASAGSGQRKIGTVKKLKIAPAKTSSAGETKIAPARPNQQPRPKGTGYVGSDRYGLYAGSNTHEPTADTSIKTALKGGVLDPPANKTFAVIPPSKPALPKKPAAAVKPVLPAQPKLLPAKPSGQSVSAQPVIVKPAAVNVSPPPKPVKAAVPPPSEPSRQSLPESRTGISQAAAEAKPGEPPRRKIRRNAEVPIEPAGSSVSDRLRQLSGRSYDLYQDRFLTHVRQAIRKVLSSGRGIFFTLGEDAEDLVYNFLEAHYSDPYMNWAESAERRELAALGFELESLNSIIDECYKRLN